jgi:hypothetical protein
MEPDPNREAIHKQIEARIRKVGTRLGAWTERAQQDKVLANLDANADLYVIADLLRQKLAIEQQMQELRITCEGEQSVPHNSAPARCARPCMYLQRRHPERSITRTRGVRSRRIPAFAFRLHPQECPRRGRA